LTRDQVDEYFLTVAEVAEVLRLNQQTVRNWIDQGSLPALRVGRRVRIKRSDLDRLLSEGYRARSHAEAPDAGPSAEDFWGGELVGVAERSGADDPDVRGFTDDGGEATSAVADAAGDDTDSAADAPEPTGTDPAADAPETTGTDPAGDRAEPAARSAVADPAA
jgi:excisionase family DNA binding protein